MSEPVTESFSLVQIGTDVSVEITPFTIGVAGAATYATAASLDGKADRVNERRRNLLDETSGLSDGLENYTPYKGSWDLQVDGIRYNDENPLQDAYNNARHAKVVITTPTKVATYWGAIEEWSNPTERGKSVETLTLKPVKRGNSLPNPLIEDAE